MTSENPLFIEGVEWLLSVTRNMSLWHQFLSDEGNFWHPKDFGVDSNLQGLTLVIDGIHSNIFRNKEKYPEYAKAILKAIDTEKKIKILKERYKKYAAALLDSVEKCNKDLNIKNLKKLFADYEVFSAGLQLTNTIGKSGGDKLTEKLKEIAINEIDIPTTIALITYPSEHTPLFESQLDMMKIGRDIQSKKLTKDKIHEALNKWLAKHNYIPVNFCDEPWTLKNAEDQLKSVLKKNCADEIAKAERSHKETIAKGKALLKKINDKEITILAHGIAEGTYLNEFRKNVFSNASLRMRGIFKKIAELAGSKEWRDCFFLTPDEMLEILEGKKTSLSKIKEERKIAAIYIIDGKTHILDAKRTKNLADYLQSLFETKKEEKTESTVKGFSANTGMVQGTVKIILSSKDFYKFNPGDILVTTMTSVDFVPIMGKAAAFVTNEGGITSHASIVAREMNKPCIIGTKIATKVFKDGDLVEVDADKGVVRIINKKQ